MRGHATAFVQLGLISRDSSFHTCFGDWLHAKTGVSSASDGHMQSNHWHPPRVMIRQNSSQRWSKNFSSLE